MAIDPKRVKEIFLEAAELSDETARAAYLDHACGGDAGLRARVEVLLRSHDPEGSFLGTPAAVVPDPGQAVPRTAANGSPAAAPGRDPVVTEALSGASDAVSANHGSTRMAADDEPLTFLAPPGRPDSLGRLGHYEVLQVLGRGGFGIVFRAFDEVLQRVVALKVMAPQLAATSPARKRFLREARSSAQVRHENVVQVYEVAEHPLPYLAMEFIPGETLQQRLDRVGPVEPAEVVRVGRQIADGLAAAHATDLIHRDIKPGNILLEGGAGRVKITDFGLARAADDASISQSGLIAGTPMYMAPEQARGDKLDQRADLFSLGSVLYQMAAGRPPFRANSAVAVLKRVAEDMPRDIREIISETPQWLCNIISKLHEKNPDDRYQSAREVADVLADCAAQLKANAKLKDFSRIPRSKAQPSGRRKWAVAATALLLPVLGLAVTEMAGVTHLFRGPQPAHNPTDPGNEPTSGLVAEQGSLPPTFTNSIGMEFVIVPKGKSWLGGGKGKLGDQEEVIPADFYLGKYEVTQEEWEKVMGENPSHFSRNGERKLVVKDIPDADLMRFPVEAVTWDRCQLFVTKLNKLVKEAGWVYRLPTAAEWEYACRGGPMSDKLDSDFDFYFAKPTSTLTPAQANFATSDGKTLKRTCKVGSYEANRLGLFDMHGNVGEWCLDSENAGDWAKSRVTRGGSWGGASGECRAAIRHPSPPSYRNAYVGLRLARVPSGAPSPEAKTSPLALGPFTDADVKRIAALLPTDQVSEVRKELMRRNPGFDGNVTHKIQNGIVTEFGMLTDQVTDLAPIRVFNALRALSFSQVRNSQFPDLTPLKGMNLADLELLSLHNTRVTDAGMAPFKDCKNLTRLNLTNTPVGDAGLAHFKGCKDLKMVVLSGTRVTDAGLAHLKGCRKLNSLCLEDTQVTDAGLAHFKDNPLHELIVQKTQVTDAGLAHFKNNRTLYRIRLDGTRVTDAGLVHLAGLNQLTDLSFGGTKVTDVGLTHLKGLPLSRLWIDDTAITDLTSLRGMPLLFIRLTPKNITKGLDILRDMKGLKNIEIGSRWDQSWPAAEFWQRYDKGEFK